MWLRGHSYLQPLVQSVDHSHDQTEKQKFFCVSGYQHSKNTDSKSDKYIKKKSPAKKCKQKKQPVFSWKQATQKITPYHSHCRPNWGLEHPCRRATRLAYPHSAQSPGSQHHRWASDQPHSATLLLGKSRQAKNKANTVRQVGYRLKLH